MEKTLSPKEMEECFREVFEMDFIKAQQIRNDISSNLVVALKDLAQSQKELNEQKDRIHELEKTLGSYKKHLMSNHRNSDPPDINLA
jgi:hypothetical protein